MVKKWKKHAFFKIDTWLLQCHVHDAILIPLFISDRSQTVTRITHCHFLHNPSRWISAQSSLQITPSNGILSASIRFINWQYWWRYSGFNDGPKKKMAESNAYQWTVKIIVWLSCLLISKCNVTQLTLQSVLSYHRIISGIPSVTLFSSHHEMRIQTVFANLYTLIHVNEFFRYKTRDLLGSKEIELEHNDWADKPASELWIHLWSLHVTKVTKNDVFKMMFFSIYFFHLFFPVFCFFLTCSSGRETRNQLHAA